MNKRIRSRAGFTLIELLIVIAIIAVLASLLLVGISAIRVRGTNLQETNDFKQLEISLNNFYGDHNKTYPPSKIVLYSSRADYYKNLNGDPQLDLDSLLAINRIWPNIGDFTYINWTSTVNPPPAGYPSKGIILEADQCLVFFLGGVFDPTQNGCMGFSTNHKNPAADGPAGERKKYFEFPNARLNTSKHPSFPSYIDNYRQMPYIYFAPGLPGGSTPNQYNAKHAVTITYPDATTDVVSPYYDGSKKGNNAWNPKSFQIISAGADGRFGSLGDWQNGTSPAAGRAWADNRSNFSMLVLGVPAQ